MKYLKYYFAAVMWTVGGKLMFSLWIVYQMENGQTTTIWIKRFQEPWKYFCPGVKCKDQWKHSIWFRLKKSNCHHLSVRKTEEEPKWQPNSYYTWLYLLAKAQKEKNAYCIKKIWISSENILIETSCWLTIIIKR